MRVYRLMTGLGVGQDRHGNLEGLHNHHRVSAGIQMSFSKWSTDPNFTVEHMKAGDETNSSSHERSAKRRQVDRIDPERVILRENGGDTWVLTPTERSDELDSVIYPD